MVRYDAADGELRWARVESWEDAGHPIIYDIGRELTTRGAAESPVTIEIRQIADWGIWVDGKGVIEGADSEGAGRYFS